jgi:hypothetical protein
VSARTRCKLEAYEDQVNHEAHEGHEGRLPLRGIRLQPDCGRNLTTGNWKLVASAGFPLRDAVTA